VGAPLRERVTEPPRLVLGSGSPRRREILESLGIAFVVVTAPVDEDVHDGEAGGAYLERVVAMKLDAVRRALPAPLVASASTILVADTCVLAPGILGKPSNVEEAYEMIQLLAGRAHEVHTRFALASVVREGAGAFVHAETVRTRVTFRSLTPAQARVYAETGEGLDKAGAYAVQGKGGAFVERIEGSYTGVVGLPACEVAVALEGRGLR